LRRSIGIRGAVELALTDARYLSLRIWIVCAHTVVVVSE
jgi:hypothetical protein